MYSDVQLPKYCVCVHACVHILYVYYILPPQANVLGIRASNLFLDVLIVHIQSLILYYRSTWMGPSLLMMSLGYVYTYPIYKLKLPL